MYASWKTMDQLTTAKDSNVFKEKNSQVISCIKEVMWFKIKDMVTFLHDQLKQMVYCT